jgi:hypothetical protein
LSFEREHRIAQVYNEWDRNGTLWEIRGGLVSFYMVFYFLIERGKWNWSTRNKWV